MRLKNMALFALICVALLTVLLLSDFIVSVVNFSQGAGAALAVVTSLIHLLAGFSVVLFLYAFYKSRS